MAQFTFPAQSVSISGAAQETTLQQVADNTAHLNVVDKLDSVLVDTSVTNIPASSGSPLQVVASLAAATVKVQSVEDIGSYIGLYVGAPSSETLMAVLPLGGGEVEVQLAASSRISLKALENTAISSGKIAINFLG